MSLDKLPSIGSIVTHNSEKKSLGIVVGYVVGYIEDFYIVKWLCPEYMKYTYYSGGQGLAYYSTIWLNHIKIIC